MTKSGKDYTFFIVGSTKTIKLGKKKPNITLGSRLEHYLEFLKTWWEKGDRNQLLLSHIEPHRPISTAIVARWVKGVLG